MTAISAVIHAWFVEGTEWGEQAHSVGESSTSSLAQASYYLHNLLGCLFCLRLLGGAGVRLALGVDPLALGCGLLERLPAACESVVDRYVY